jgi:DNA-binding transcriptional regulator YdaS (Cro superfamily)
MIDLIMEPYLLKRNKDDNKTFERIAAAPAHRCVELTRAERGGVMCEENLVTVSRESALRGAIGSEPNSEM